MAKQPTPEGIRFRKYADRSTGERVVRFDPETGAKKLVNPATPGNDHEPWPLAGVDIVDDKGQPVTPPARTTLTTTMVAAGIAEGWITGEGEAVVVRPGGPPADPYRVTHTFRHFTRFTIHTLSGDVVYTVTHQPDKYADGQAANDGPVAGDFDDDTPVSDDLYAAGATRVDHFYGLVKEN